MNPPLASVLLGLLIGSSPLAGPLFSPVDASAASSLPGEVQLLVGECLSSTPPIPYGPLGLESAQVGVLPRRALILSLEMPCLCHVRAIARMHPQL